MQDPARAIQLPDGAWYVVGACDVSADYAALCLFQASDGTLSSFAPASGRVYFSLGTVRPDTQSSLCSVSKVIDSHTTSDPGRKEPGKRFSQFRVSPGRFHCPLRQVLT